MGYAVSQTDLTTGGVLMHIEPSDGDSFELHVLPILRGDAAR